MLTIIIFIKCSDDGDGVMVNKIRRRPHPYKRTYLIKQRKKKLGSWLYQPSFILLLSNDLHLIKKKKTMPSIITSNNTIYSN